MIKSIKFLTVTLALLVAQQSVGMSRAKKTALEPRVVINPDYIKNKQLGRKVIDLIFAESNPAQYVVVFEPTPGDETPTYCRVTEEVFFAEQTLFQLMQNSSINSDYIKNKQLGRKIVDLKLLESYPAQYQVIFGDAAGNSNATQTTCYVTEEVYDAEVRLFSLLPRK